MALWFVSNRNIPQMTLRASSTSSIMVSNPLWHRVVVLTVRCLTKELLYIVAPNDATKRLYQLYPGPLLRGPTHKKQVIEFCQEQIRLGPSGGSSSLRSVSNSIASLQSLDQPIKTSYTLMWNLLILLLRQNGSAVGTDIAELLLKNKEEFPYEYQSISSRIVDRASESQHSAESDDKQSNEENASNEGQQQITEPVALSEIEITEKFRNFLLYGSVIEALGKHRLV